MSLSLPPRGSVDEKNGKYDWLEQALSGAETKAEAAALPLDGATETAASVSTVGHEASSAPVVAETRSDPAEFDKPDNGRIEATPQLGEPDLVSVAEPVVLAAEEPQTAADEPSAAPSGPAIIGRYESNGASYVLYADGTIDATTQSGGPSLRVDG